MAPSTPPPLSFSLMYDSSWVVVAEGLHALQVSDFNLSRVMEASSMVSSIAATNPRYAL